MAGQALELTQDLYEQATQLLHLCLQEGQALPVYNAFSPSQKIVAYPNRESMLREVASDKPRMVMFVSQNFLGCRDWLRATYGTNNDYLGFSLHVPTTIAGVVYSSSLIIGNEGMVDSVKRRICTRLHANNVDEQVYTGWTPIERNSFGQYDPLHLSSKTQKAVLYLKGSKLDRLLFDPDIEWENMVLILIHSFLQPKGEAVPPYVWEGDPADVIGYDADAADPSLDFPEDERTSVRIALVYMFLLAPFYSSAQRRAAQLHRRYSAAVASVEQEPIGLPQFNALATRFGLGDKQPTNTIIDFIGRCIARDSNGHSDVNCFKSNLMTTEAMAVHISDETVERRFLVALYDSLRMVCEGYNAKTLSFAVEIIPLLTEAGYDSDAKVNAELQNIAVVRPLVERAPFFNMKDSIPANQQVASYPYLIGIALMKKEIDVAGTPQESMWRDYNSGNILNKSLEINMQLYCRHIARALPTNVIVAYSQLAAMVSAEQMHNAMATESDEVKNAVYHYVGRKETPGEWHEEETKRRMSHWLQPKLDEAENFANKTKRSVIRSLEEVPLGVENDPARQRLERALVQVKAGIVLIQEWNEEVTARTTTNVDPKNKYVELVAQALRGIKTMIIESSEGNGATATNNLKLIRNQM